MNTGKKGENELERKMIRPMLEYGDALLFDCRILHFGLANSSSYINRPILYINYHHKSFRDPKNWNDHEKLFP
jgi:ectoine hydroxylase-related dioxygenase (phytanoyl-CoA dioxygenase family)